MAARCATPSPSHTTHTTPSRTRAPARAPPCSLDRPAGVSWAAAARPLLPARVPARGGVLSARRPWSSRRPTPQEPERKKLPQQKKNPWQQGWQHRFDQRQQVQYSSSIDIRPEWSVVEQITHQALGKLSCKCVVGLRARAPARGAGRRWWGRGGGDGQPPRQDAMPVARRRPSRVPARLLAAHVPSGLAACRVGEPQELVEAGRLEYYDKAFDRVSAR